MSVRTHSTRKSTSSKRSNAERYSRECRGHASRSIRRHEGALSRMRRRRGTSCSPDERQRQFWEKGIGESTIQPVPRRPVGEIEDTTTVTRPRRATPLLGLDKRQTYAADVRVRRRGGRRRGRGTAVVNPHNVRTLLERPNYTYLTGLRCKAFSGRLPMPPRRARRRCPFPRAGPTLNPSPRRKIGFGR